MSSPEERGKKLGFLIASLEMSADQREALFSLLPEMTEEQLEELTKILEASYLQAVSKDADDQMAIDLAAIEKKYQQNMAKINSDVTKDLNSIA